MEMPRCCSISIQSDTACRWVFRPRTAPGELDGARVQQQLLGERRLAGVGMGDDGERPPPRGLAGNGVVDGDVRQQ
jgi:hypothetical protein